MGEMQVSYAAAAKLYVFPPEHGFARYIRGGAIYAGTLAGAVRKFLSLEPRQQAAAWIGLGAGAIEGSRGLIRATEIRVIAQRPDFPSR